MQKFIGLGNLVKEIELKETSNGKMMARNSIAIRNDYKNADGEYGTEFVNILVWGKQAEYLANYAHKGTKIIVEGKLQTSSYDAADGTKRYSTEVVCSNVEIVQSANQSANKETIEEDEKGMSEELATNYTTEEIDDLPF